MIYNNGDMYIGEWKDNKACGYGEFYHVDGAEYKGYWENDKQHGKGYETWPEGTVYDGEFH